MSRKKRMQNVREAKDRRMKKIAIGGGIVLVALLAFEIPHFLGSKKSAAPPATTAAAGTPTPTATTPGTAAPATSAPATATPATAAPTASAKLTNSDLPPRSTKGQLASFSTFDSKDPFASQIPTAPCTCAGAPSGSGSVSAPAAGTPPASSAPVVTSTRTLAHSGAVMLMVNGKRESVRVGASFPSSNPIFRLVAVTHGAVRIGLASGSYASGTQTVLLRPNRTITLVDTTNHAHYKLQLLLGS